MVDPAGVDPVGAARRVALEVVVARMAEAGPGWSQRRLCSVCLPLVEVVAEADLVVVVAPAEA